MSQDERYEFRKTVSSELSITDFLVDFFLDKALPQFGLLKDKHFSQSKDRRFLLVLDNCDGLIEHSGEDFRNLLSYFCD